MRSRQRLMLCLALLLLLVTMTRSFTTTAAVPRRSAFGRPKTTRSVRQILLRAQNSGNDNEEDFFLLDKDGNEVLIADKDELLEELREGEPSKAAIMKEVSESSIVLTTSIFVTSLVQSIFLLCASKSLTHMCATSF